MDLKEFKALKLAYGHITCKNFGADICYSPTGSGHYFTLSHIVGTVRGLYDFLHKWEKDHMFCIITYSPEVFEMLAKHGYTTDADGHMRIGLKEDVKFSDTAKEKKSLPRRDGRDKKKIPSNIKAHVQDRISKRKEAAE